jgi:PST family polysaccharide transporter
MTEKQYIKSKAISGAFWTVSGAAGQQLFAFVVFTILARNLTPTEFGSVAIVIVIIEFLNVFGRAGLTDVLIYRSDLSDSDLDTSFWLSFLLGAAGSTALWISAPTLSWLYAAEDLTNIVHLLAVSVFIYSLGTNPEALMRRNFEFKVLAARSMLATIVAGVIALIMVFEGFGIYALVCQRLAFATLNTLLLWVWTSYRPKLRFSFLEARRQLKMGVWLAASVFVSMATPKAFDLLIGYVLGLRALGYYRIASRYLDLILDFTIRPLSSVALSSFSALQTDPTARNRAYLRVVQLTALIVFPAFTGAALVSPEALILLFGEQWRPSIPVVYILALAAVPFPILFHGTSIFTAVGRGKELMFLSMFDLSLSVIVAAALAPLGLEAAALGYIGRALASVPLFLVLLRIHTALSPSKVLAVLIPPACATAVMVLIVYGMRAHLGSDKGANYFALLLYVPLGVLAYSITLLAFKPVLLDLVKLFRKDRT